VIAGLITLAAWISPAAVEAQRVSGSGQQATAVFALPVGLVVFELEHSGEGDFVVRLLDERGVLVDTLVRATGSFRGSKAVHVPRSGGYLYDVLARGAWSISPRPAPVASTGADVPVPDPSAAPTVMSPPSATPAGTMNLEASLAAEQAARAKGSFRWMLGGLAGGTVLGPVGAGLVFVAANRREQPPLADIEARRAAHGAAYADAFAAAYQTRRRSDRRVAALVGGASGTVIFGFVIAQVINWSRKSGGGGPGNGELP